jgi:hypothetical protein
VFDAFVCYIYATGKEAEGSELGKVFDAFVSYRLIIIEF